MTRQELEALADRYALQHGLPAALVRGVIQRESGWNPAATSGKGAMGLMQLMPDTAGDLGIADPYDPEQNIAGGTRYLAQLYDRYKDPRLALGAYHAGMGNVQKYGNQVPPFKITQDYVQALAPLWGETMIPTTAFPQFALAGIGRPPPAAAGGVLGAMPAQSLLGSTQPQSLLDRFAPGSGYGYDVALGIANTQGPPMTALAGGFAHAKDRAFERQMAEANLGLAQSKLSMPPKPTSAMRNYEYLISQNVDPKTARAAAFGRQGLTVNVGQPGTTQYGSVPSGYTRTITAEGQAIDMPNPGTEAYEKRQQAKRTSDSAITAINKLKSLVDVHGEGLGLIGDPGVKLEMGTLYEEILAALGTLSNAGVMDQGEVQRFRESLPDPREKFTFAGGKDIKQAYDVLLQRMYRVKGEKMPEKGPKPTHRMNPQTGEIEPIS